ncbi:MAG: hypothetical protein OXF49_01510 [Candidatus Saccharibacteria bacterium]|nr:hypothetical protein [Candidatus Saccharibacteria bacterium]
MYPPNYPWHSRPSTAYEDLIREQNGLMGKFSMAQKLGLIVCLLALVGIGIFMATYFMGKSDAPYYSVAGHQNADESILQPVSKHLKIHSPELQSIVNDLKLTDRGLEILDNIDDVILYYSQKSVLASCGYNPDTSEVDGVILGCYGWHEADIYFKDLNGDGIWNKNETIEISGDILVVSDEANVSDTMAHEFLHAVYIRLSDEEREDLDKLLNQAYKSNKTALDRFLKPYNLTARDNDIKMNELHSFIGTQIDDLPTALENHYSKYFKNRAVVVALSKDKPIYHSDYDHLPKPKAQTSEEAFPEITVSPPQSPPAQSVVNPPASQPQQPQPQPSPPQSPPAQNSATPQPLLAEAKDLLATMKHHNKKFEDAMQVCNLTTFEDRLIRNNDLWDDYNALKKRLPYLIAGELKQIVDNLDDEQERGIDIYDAYMEVCVVQPLIREWNNLANDLQASYKRIWKHLETCNLSASAIEVDSAQERLEEAKGLDEVLDMLENEGYDVYSKILSLSSDESDKITAYVENNCASNSPPANSDNTSSNNSSNNHYSAFVKMLDEKESIVDKMKIAYNKCQLNRVNNLINDYNINYDKWLKRKNNNWHRLTNRQKKQLNARISNIGNQAAKEQTKGRAKCNWESSPQYDELYNNRKAQESLLGEFSRHAASCDLDAWNNAIKKSNRLTREYNAYPKNDLSQADILFFNNWLDDDENKFDDIEQEAVKSCNWE